MDRQQDQRLVFEQQGEQPQNGDGDMDGEGVAKGPIQIDGDAAAQAQGPHQIHEGVIKQHQIGRFPRHRRAPLTHGHPDIGGLEGRRVVDAIPRHRHHLAGRLQGPHQLQFLLGHHPGKHRHLGHQLVEALGGHALQVGAAEHGARGQAGLVGDGAGRDRAIAGDHHHPDAGPAGDGDRPGHIGPQGIRQTHQAHRLKQVVVDICRRLSPAGGALAPVQLHPWHTGGYCQHPQALACQAVGGGQQLLP